MGKILNVLFREASVNIVGCPSNILVAVTTALQFLIKLIISSLFF